MGCVDLGLNSRNGIVYMQLAVMKTSEVTFRGLTVLLNLMNTYSAIHKAAGLTVPGRSIIWLVQFMKIHEAMNRGMVSEGHSCQWHFVSFCREWLVTKSTIYKAAGLMVPSCSIIWLVQLQLQFHHSSEKCPIGCEWELAAGTASGGHSSQKLFGNSWLLRSRRLCE